MRIECKDTMYIGDFVERRYYVIGRELSDTMGC